METVTLRDLLLASKAGKKFRAFRDGHEYSPTDFIPFYSWADTNIIGDWQVEWINGPTQEEVQEGE